MSNNMICSLSLQSYKPSQTLKVYTLTSSIICTRCCNTDHSSSYTKLGASDTLAKTLNAVIKNLIKYEDLLITPY